MDEKVKNMVRVNKVKAKNCTMRHKVTVAQKRLGWWYGMITRVHCGAKQTQCTATQLDFMEHTKSSGKDSYSSWHSKIAEFDNYESFENAVEGAIIKTEKNKTAETDEIFVKALQLERNCAANCFEAFRKSGKAVIPN